MKMVSSEVVMQTVKRMVDSDIDDETIKNTLRDINISEDEITILLNQAKGIPASRVPQIPTQVKPVQKEPEESEEIEESEEEPEENANTYESQEKYIPDSNERNTEQSAQHVTTHNMLEEHGEKIENVRDSVSQLHERIGAATLSPETIGKLTALDERITSLEKEVADTKAIANAVKGLLEKILETDKKVLLEVKKKK